MMKTKARFTATIGTVMLAVSLSLFPDVSFAARIIQGRVDGNCTILAGVGFSTVSIPAGTGGSNVGSVNVTNGSSSVTGVSTTFTAQLVPSQFVKIDGDFYQVASISNDTSLQLTRPYAGATASGIPMTKDMTLFNACTVTFASPFHKAPAVVVSVASFPQPDLPATGNPVVSNIYIDSTGGITRSGFRIFFSPFSPSSLVPPYLPGIANEWSFIAIR